MSRCCMTLDDIIGRLENAKLKYGKHTEVMILDNDTSCFIPISRVGKYENGIALIGDIDNPIAAD